jgi:Flp pilus assembly protein TadD
MRPRLTLLLLFTLSACGVFGGRGDGVDGSAASVAHSSDRIIDAAMRASMPDVALRVANEQLQADPHDASAFVRQGDAYRAMGRSQEAEASYSQALAILPGEPRAGIGKGMIMLRRDPAGAAAAFRLVLALHPRDVQALTGQGVAFDLLGEHAKAQASYRDALAAQPGLRAATADLGLSLALSGDTAAALALLQPLANDGTASRRERDNLAVALQLAGREAEARRILREEMSDADASATLASYRQLR